ncbi:MAG: hypothetical protein INR73_17295 [Williamsia sp.]|nr:hypothetical protein [Williamsia sp.]
MKIGIERLLHDLSGMGYGDVERCDDHTGVSYAVMKGFEIPAGTFAGRIIDLAVPAPPNFPQGVTSSIHIKASPILVTQGMVTGIRNVLPSNLGIEWQYWSYNFVLPPGNPTAELITKINEIFRRN